jgi:hypothetical protein
MKSSRWLILFLVIAGFWAIQRYGAATLKKGPAVESAPVNEAPDSNAIRYDEALRKSTKRSEPGRRRAAQINEQEQTKGFLEARRLGVDYGDLQNARRMGCSTSRRKGAPMRRPAVGQTFCQVIERMGFPDHRRFGGAAGAAPAAAREGDVVYWDYDIGADEVHIVTFNWPRVVDVVW